MTGMETTETLMGRALPAALQMLSDARSSCIVSVACEEGTATIALRKGNILWATSNKTQRLGDSLVEKGFVDRDVLEGVLSMQKRKRTRDPVCRILCELGLLSEEVARMEIEQQTTDVFVDALGWGRGTMRVEAAAADTVDEALNTGQEIEPLLVRAALVREGFGAATREMTCDGIVVVE